MKKQKRSKKKKPIQRDAFGVLARAVGRYLNTQGWNVLLVGTPRVQKQPCERTFNYEFVMRITAKPPDESGGDRARGGAVPGVLNP